MFKDIRDIREFKVSDGVSHVESKLYTGRKDGINVLIKLLNFYSVKDDNDIMLITDQGIVIRISSDKVSKMSRVTQGIRLMNLREGQRVATVSVVEKEIENDQTDASE